MPLLDSQKDGQTGFGSRTEVIVDSNKGSTTSFPEIATKNPRLSQDLIEAQYQLLKPRSNLQCLPTMRYLLSPSLLRPPSTHNGTV